MPPKYLESNFDTMVPTLSQGFFDRDNTDDFVSLMNDVVANYDFTNVDTDAASNMVSMAAKNCLNKRFSMLQRSWRKASIG